MLGTTEQKYILHWGEMGARWGVNRTVAQIHALLFLADEPLNAEQIAETLTVARSNVSTSLKELQSWGLIKLAHVMGDRRDHFIAHQDPWDIFRIVLEERKKRELDPTLTVLRECALEAPQDSALSAAKQQRMTAVLDMLELLMTAYEDFKHLSPSTLKRMMKMGGTLARLLPADKAPEN